MEEKRKYFADISIEVEKSDAEVQVNVTDNPPPLHPHPGGKRASSNYPPSSPFLPSLVDV